MEEELYSLPPIGPFFRFPDEEFGMLALEAAGFVFTDEDNNKQVYAYSHNHALDVIGPIVRGGEWDEDGNVITPPEVLPGWHVNYQGELPEGWEQYAVYPTEPVRTWG